MAMESYLLTLTLSLQPYLVSACSLSTSACRDAKIYESSLEAVKDVAPGSKVLVGGERERERGVEGEIKEAGPQI